MSPHVCPWWFAYSFDNPLRSLLHPPASVLAPWVREGMTVLDVGCGIGHFSLGLARLVGPSGKVIAADLQERALAAVRRRARRAGLDGRIATHRCAPDRVGVEGPVDFALAFWMVHETPSVEGFFREMAGTLRAGAPLLVAEPRIHVGDRDFGAELDAAAAAGLRVAERPRVRASHAAILRA